MAEDKVLVLDQDISNIGDVKFCPESQGSENRFSILKVSRKDFSPPDGTTLCEVPENDPGLYCSANLNTNEYHKVWVEDNNLKIERLTNPPNLNLLWEMTISSDAEHSGVGLGPIKYYWEVPSNPEPISDSKLGVIGIGDLRSDGRSEHHRMFLQAPLFAQDAPRLELYFRANGGNLDIMGTIQDQNKYYNHEWYTYATTKRGQFLWVPRWS